MTEEGMSPKAMQIMRRWHESGVVLDDAKAQLAVGFFSAMGGGLTAAQKELMHGVMMRGFRELNRAWGIDDECWREPAECEERELAPGEGK